jgi:FkbM family methyltransferase
MDKMLIKLSQIISDYKLNIRGVIHIGAHYGQEYNMYAEQGVKNMLFFEPVKANYKKLCFRVLRRNDIKLYNLALGNETGERRMYIEKVKGQSCSFLEPGTHLELHPHIKFTGFENVTITKLDNVVFDRELFNMINIDVQGFELEVFKGSAETLKSIDVIYTEVNFEDVYKGCCLVSELDEFLNVYGFKRVLTKDSKSAKDRNTWGDALYIKRKPVDFEVSVKKSYCFNQKVFDDNKIKWDLLKALYQKNFVDIGGKRDYDVLPKKIHQIWLGSDPLECHVKLVNSWKKFNPDWEYRLWMDKDVDDLLPDRNLYDSMNNYGSKSDLLRYYILDKFGGLYIDTDFECFKSFNAFTHLNFLMGVGYPSKVEFYNALIGCTPNHPVIKNMINSIVNKKVTGSQDIFRTTGNYLFTDKFFEVVIEPVDGVLIMPTEYFYAYPNKPGFEKDNSRKYITEYSYAIHYWELLWIKAHQEIIKSGKQVRKY